MIQRCAIMHRKVLFNGIFEYLYAQGTNRDNGHAVFSSVTVAATDNHTKQSRGSTFDGIDAICEFEQVGSASINMSLA